MTWPPSTHQDTEDLLTSLRSAPWVGGAAPTGTASGSTFLRGDGAWAAPATNTGGSSNSGDHHVYVSKSGSDANNGLSWATAKLTIGAGLGLLSGAGSGTVNVGDGVYQETVTMTQNKTLRGQSRYGTIIELTANGNLVTVNAENNCRIEHMGLRFASSSITGTLLYHTNSFTCDYYDVRLSGTTTTNQIGYRYDANAGDSHFVNCYFDNLQIGVRANSTLILFDGCVFSSCTKSVESGDPTGATAPGGAIFDACVFRGAGTHYVHINGKSQAFHFKGCWFDGGGATTAVEVGTGTFGPWLFSMVDCPSMLGGTTSLKLNAADFVLLHGVVFGNAGSFPTDLSVDATNCPRGSVASCFSLQGTKIETLVPARWLGARHIAQSGDGSVSLLETYNDVRWGTSPQVHKRIVVRVTGRTTGTSTAVVTYPTAFATSEFVKVFDNSGGSPTVSSTSITFTTGTASAGLVVIEGF